MEKTYLVYLDEFGHVGPYIARTDPRHKTSPVFGFGGVIIPADQVRAFSTWFYKLKCNLLAWEIERDGIPPFQWEKKGAALYTTNNIQRYRGLRQATFRLLNKIREVGGCVLYVGMEKTADPVSHKPNNMTFGVLKAAIRRLDEFCSREKAGFLLFLDHRDDKPLRDAVIAVTQREMYGQDPKWTLLEAPTQVESHLYQAMQAADWICALIGRLEAFRASPEEFRDMEWSERYFGQRMKMVATHSSVKKQNASVAVNAARNHRDEGDEIDDDTNASDNCP